MPKDTRLYMTFPNDFAEHPKIMLLSDAAFRAFVEMNGYSRMQDLDGRIPVRVARAKWKQRALKELESNHPERPTLMIIGEDYVIRDYEKHQQTRAEREARQERNAANGRLGGRPRKNPPKTQSVTDSPPQPPPQSLPKSDSESGGEPKPNKKQSQSQSQSFYQDFQTSSPESNRARGTDEADLEALCVRQAAALGVDFSKARLAVGKATGRIPSPSVVMRIIATILERATPPVKSPTGLVLTCIQTGWAEWQKFIDTEEAAA